MERLGKRRSLVRQWLCTGLRAAAALALLALALLAARAAWEMYGRFAASSEASAGAQAELARLESQYARVSASVDDFSSARGVEARIRERYGLARPGEGQLIIVRPALDAGATSTASSEGFFSRLFSALVVW